MNAAVKTTCVTKAHKAWGAELPDWVETLAQACDQSSQAQIANKIGKSKATVSLVLTRQYNAGLNAIEQAVRGILMEATVACPVVGDIALDQCHRNQRNTTGHGLERKLFEPHCRTCRHRRGN
jgi:hypothetical protein